MQGSPLPGVGAEPTTLSVTELAKGSDSNNACYVKSPCTSWLTSVPRLVGAGRHLLGYHATIYGKSGGKVIMARRIDEDALGALLEAQAVREVRVSRQGALWGLSVRLGATWHPVRSRREQVRTWASLTAVGRFLDRFGVTKFEVEL